MVITQGACDQMPVFDKLYHYGIRGLALDWVKSYFSGRKGRARVNSRSAFFILYINDLNNASKLESILFADDTNLFISHMDP